MSVADVLRVAAALTLLALGPWAAAQISGTVASLALLIVPTLVAAALIVISTKPTPQRRGGRRR
jgi:hypothetical protein